MSYYCYVKDMISKQSIIDGLEKGIITIEDEGNGYIDSSYTKKLSALCCKIGHMVFIFANDRSILSLSAEEYLSSRTTEDIAEDLYKVLANVETATAMGINSIELEYYRTVLIPEIVSKEMITRGLEQRIITIEDEYYGCVELCCKIGDYAFYFLSDTNDISAEEYLQSRQIEDVVGDIYTCIRDAVAAEETGLDEAEYGYYVSLLSKE